MSEKSVGWSLLTMKCPKCHEGNLFTSKNPYVISKIHEMPHECPKCGQLNELEPGFYYGAMYVNYGFAVLLTVVTYLLLEVVLKVSAYTFFSAYILALFVLGPWMFRYSRTIYLYFFVRYDKDAIKKHNISM